MTFHHEELTSATPTVNTQLVFYPVDIWEAKKVVHKPVLFRVFDAGGQPLSGLEVDATYSNGDLMDDVKGVTDGEGMAVMELVPGRSSVSLKRRNCAMQVERADVNPGSGVDSFKLGFVCEKKEKGR